MSKLRLTEILDKLKAAGYKVVMDLIPDEKGIKLSLMTNNMHIESMLEMYGEKDGFHIYEAKLKTRDDFMKMHDIFAAI